MLKRNDLAKQFELVVQQEIKNYQDSLNGVLQSLRDLKKEISDSREEALENHAAIHSYQTDLAMDIARLKVQIDEVVKTQGSNCRDQGAINTRNSEKLNELTGHVQNVITSYQTHYQKSCAAEVALRLKEESHRKLLDSVHQKMDQVVAKCEKGIERVKKEARDHPREEAEHVKRHLEEKIACHTVDVSGLLNEMTVSKKRLLIAEKKLEHIYMLMDKTKDGGNKKP